MTYRIAIMVNAEQCALIEEALEVYQVWGDEAEREVFAETYAEVSRIMAKFPAQEGTLFELGLAMKEAEERKIKTGVCTFPCSGPQDCKCTQQERTVKKRKIVKRRKS